MRTIHVYTVTKECVVEIEDDQTMDDALALARKGVWGVAQATFLCVEPDVPPAPEGECSDGFHGE